MRDAKKIQTVTILALVVSVLTLLIKFVAFHFTKSTAVLSDALESIVNVVTAITAIWVMRAVAEPADKEHPYGHGKLEYFSAAFEGGLIAFAAIAIAGEAMRSLYEGRALLSLDFGILAIASTAILNFLMALYLKHVAGLAKSEALTASSAHLMSDVWTTITVVVGLGLVYLTGHLWIDSLLALMMSGHLAMSGYRIVRKSIGGLIDEVDLKALEKLATALAKCRVPGLIDIHNLRVIRAGNFHHVDAHLVVPEFWDVAKTHRETQDFEKRVVTAYPWDGEIAFHIDPCERKYCKNCELMDCRIRQNAFERAKEFSVQDLIRGVQDAK